MTELLGFVKELISSQPFLQVFVGGITFLLIAYMVIRARGDRDHLPPPAVATIADVPQPFLQGPREAVDILRELRDLARRKAEDASRIAECVRVIRERSDRTVELLDKIEREQQAENRAHGRDRS